MKLPEGEMRADAHWRESIARGQTRMHQDTFPGKKIPYLPLSHFHTVKPPPAVHRCRPSSQLHIFFATCSAIKSLSASPASPALLLFAFLWISLETRASTLETPDCGSGQSSLGVGFPDHPRYFVHPMIADVVMAYA